MAWFRRSSSAVIAAPAAVQRRYVAPATGDTFLVSGVSFRQEALRRAGVRRHQFRLVREPTNPVDPYAVAVWCLGGHHIGYVSAKIAARYCDAIERVERSGCELWVCGSIEGRERGHLVAVIDCPWPEDI